MFPRFAALPVLFVSLLISGCTGKDSANAAGTRVKAERERKSAPEFALKDADGRVVRLSEYKGKVVLLNFWATWCGPCKLEMPWFIDFERKYKDKGFAVIGISMDEEGWPVVKPFINNLAVNYRVLQGDDKTAELYGGVEALPTSFLIDREGRIANTLVGLHGRDEIDHGIQQLLETASGRVPAPRSTELARAN